jgi:glutathione peroxidase-family protein
MSIPHLKDLYAQYKASGFEIIGVAVNDKQSSVRGFVQNVGIDYVICMGDLAVATDYRISNIPNAFLLDRDGNIAARYIGYQKKSVLEEAIRQLL